VAQQQPQAGQDEHGGHQVAANPGPGEDEQLKERGEDDEGDQSPAHEAAPGLQRPAVAAAAAHQHEAQPQEDRVQCPHVRPALPAPGHALQEQERAGAGDDRAGNRQRRGVRAALPCRVQEGQARDDDEERPEQAHQIEREDAQLSQQEEHPHADDDHRRCRPA